MTDRDHRAGSGRGEFVEHVRGPHRARWLGTVDAAYSEMEHRIDRAADAVRVETYLMREPGPANWLRAALLRARARGVRVRLLLDAFGCEGLRDGFLEPLREAGAEIAVFNPHRYLRRTFRNHRKLFACDGQHAIVGGFNIAPEYAGDGVTRGWCDCGVYVGGPFVRQLEASFDAMFDLAPFTPGAIRAFRKTMRHRWRMAMQDDSPIRLLASGPALTRGALGRTLRRDLAGSRDVAIASAYFLPSPLLRRLLYRVASGPGRVRVLLAGNSDVPLARLAAQRLYVKLLSRRVRILEYQPQVLHAKVVVMDGIAYAGSCNLDRRSLFINYELLLRFDWPELAADARAWFAGARRHAALVRLSRWRRAHGPWLRLWTWLAWLLLARLDPLLARRAFRGLT